MSTIKASRNGEIREFDLEFWKNMPDDKYGWKAAAEVPQEVKELAETKTELTSGEEVVLKAAAEVPQEVKVDEVKTTKGNKNAEAKK